MICRAINTALAVQEALSYHVDVKPTTKTVALIDDIIPEDMDKDIETQERLNSAIHIQIIAKAGLVELQQASRPMTSHPSRNRTKHK
ncbi:hypothetical protein EC973_008654 [Apophysomyces ossiformis]|uniref:Uncharacterized protein n=1 Tax=Apophysomyces ossiformis TaxID=679940 RepID=A0A8H7ENY3_9FUNG|nr:hypothetical protein EC973_008654 [Apophysomyces ossiformis]